MLLTRAINKLLFGRFKNSVTLMRIYNIETINKSRQFNTSSTTKKEIGCCVEVTHGKLEGKVTETCYGQRIYSFEGIPYAKPPTGELRFKDPQEPECWSGVRNAKQPANKCPQLYLTKQDEVDGSEDCLYLNVYTPTLLENVSEKLPVIVYVHGGNFIMGYGHYHRPDFLIKHGVIIVTINYRLHILGFLCLNIPEVPGNAGLKDTVLALKWVQNNIERFNGDKHNVTVMGESVGGGIATSYLTSKMADGLYNKVICHSVNTLTHSYISNEDHIAKARRTLSFMNKDIHDKYNLYKELKRIDIKTLVAITKSANSGRHSSVINPLFQPIVEEKFEGVERFYEEPPYLSIKNNRFNSVPVLGTVASHEGAAFLNYDGNNVVFENDFEHFVPVYLSKPKTDVEILASKIRNRYMANGMTLIDYVNMLSEHYFSRDMVLFLNLMSNVSKDTYFCRFAYNGNLNIRTMKRLNLKGSTHGDLIQYLFYNKNKHTNCNAQDENVIDFLVESFCNFAKTSVPSTTNKDVKWLPYNSEDMLTLNIDNQGFRMETYPEHQRIRFWLDNIIKDRHDY